MSRYTYYSSCTQTQQPDGVTPYRRKAFRSCTVRRQHGRPSTDTPRLAPTHSIGRKATSWFPACWVAFPLSISTKVGKLSP